MSWDMLAATIPSLRASCQQVDAMLTEDRQCSGCRFTTVSVARLWTSQLLHEIITVRHSEPGEVISGDLGAGAYSLVHRLQRCARTQPQTRILGLCLEDCVIGGAGAGDSPSSKFLAPSASVAATSTIDAFTGRCRCQSLSSGRPYSENRNLSCH